MCFSLNFLANAINCIALHWGMKLSNINHPFICCSSRALLFRYFALARWSVRFYSDVPTRPLTHTLINLLAHSRALTRTQHREEAFHDQHVKITCVYFIQYSSKGYWRKAKPIWPKLLRKRKKKEGKERKVVSIYLTLEGNFH